MTWVINNNNKLEAHLLAWVLDSEHGHTRPFLPFTFCQTNQGIRGIQTTNRSIFLPFLRLRMNTPLWSTTERSSRRTSPAASSHSRNRHGQNQLSSHLLHHNLRQQQHPLDQNHLRQTGHGAVGFSGLLKPTSTMLWLIIRPSWRMLECVNGLWRS